jgi:hypothetical protein
MSYFYSLPYRRFDMFCYVTHSEIFKRSRGQRSGFGDSLTQLDYAGLLAGSCMHEDTQRGHFLCRGSRKYILVTGQVTLVSARVLSGHYLDFDLSGLRNGD